MEMDEGCKRWLIKTARQNHWRVRRYCEVDDLIQDGYLHWQRLVQRYVRLRARPRLRAHMMSLFKITYYNHLNDTAKRTRRDLSIPVADLVMSAGDENDMWDTVMGREEEVATLFVLVQQAPRPVKAMLELLLSDDGCKQLRAPLRVRADGSRQTQKERLRRVTKVNRTIKSVPNYIKSYFSPTTT